MKYLNSSQIDKETIARDILAHDGMRSGLVCVLSCVEPLLELCYPSQSPDEKTGVEAASTTTRSILYQIHPVFGFLNARIQTWFPFSIQICRNGREWLARQMQAASLDYLQHDQLLPLDCQLDQSSALNG